MRCEEDSFEGFEGYCRECGRLTKTVTEDYGIGPYEFWGARGVHHDYRQVCPYCGGVVEETANRPCDVCRWYDPDEYPPDGCGRSAPDRPDRGDLCQFFEGTG